MSSRNTCTTQLSPDSNGAAHRSGALRCTPTQSLTRGTTSKATAPPGRCPPEQYLKSTTPESGIEVGSAEAAGASAAHPENCKLMMMPHCPRCGAFDRGIRCTGTRENGERCRVRYYACRGCGHRWRVQFFAPQIVYRVDTPHTTATSG